MGARNSIFISHASADLAWASEIYDDLKQNNCVPWMAAKDIPAGANYAENLSEALETASALVVILTHEGIKSQHVKREVNIAIDLKIPLFPVNLSGANNIMESLPRDWKYWLTIVQILNCSDPKSASSDLLHAFTRQGLNLGNGKQISNSEDMQTIPKNQFKILNERTKKGEEKFLRREIDSTSAREKPEKQANEFKKAEKEKDGIEKQKTDSVASEKLRADLAFKRDKEIRAEKIQAAGPKIEMAEKVADWLEELSDWLADIVFESSPEETNFDFEHFDSSFKKNFIVDLKGFEDVAVEIRSRIGRELLYIFRLLASNPVLTLNQPEKAKKYLDLATEYGDPWALLAQGEWLLARGDIAKARKYFLDPPQQERALQEAERAGENSGDSVDSSDLIRTVNSPFGSIDSGSNANVQKLELAKDFKFTWKWFELLVQLADSKVKPDSLQKIFQEIDQVLYKDSANPESEVYLVPPLRVKWKLLGAMVLFRLERNTAARNFLRGINEKSEDYRIASGQIYGTFNMSTGEGATLMLELVEVMDSWR